MQQLENHIEYVGSLRDHSSIYSDGLTVTKMYEDGDTVGDFYRWQIDRSSHGMSSAFLDENNDPFLYEVFAKAGEKGSLALLDAGCGTGNALFEMKDQILWRTGLQPSAVIAVGVNIDDYSQESSNRKTREAISSGDIGYIVDDLETVKLESKSFDLITSYEVLIHIDPIKVTKILMNLIQALKSDGALIFDIRPEQRKDPQIRMFLESMLKQMGFSFFEYSKHERLKREERTFVWIRPAGAL